MSNGYYEDYWSKTGWRADDGSFRMEEIQLIEKHFDKQGTIIDYGCGSGLRYGATLNKRGNNYVSWIPPKRSGRSTGSSSLKAA